MPVEWLFFVVVSYAAMADIVWRRIPNFWMLFWFLTGICLAEPEKIVSYFLCGAVVFAVFYPFWKIRLTGAGDVKLCCLMASWFGLEVFSICLLYSLFCSGFMAAVFMIYHRSFFQRISYFLAWIRQCISSKSLVPYLRTSEISKENTIPFALALGIGYFLWFWKKMR